jgi:acetylornithine deacetylase/succinyl-diaminopimelate desuccinylase-like protein
LINNLQMESLIKQIQENNREFITKDLKSFLQIPSYSLNSRGIDQAKKFIINYISEFCEEINIFEHEINPTIYAEVKGARPEKILIYMMYDTQPINKDKDWIAPPFAARTIKLNPPLDKLGDCIIARGAYNSKTSLMTFLNIIKILKKEKLLPISLLLIFDGEEEIGSPTFQEFLNQNKSKIKQCINCYYASAKQNIDKTPVLKLGYKGILSFSIKTYSKNKESHSAFSNIIANPARDLYIFLNKIYDESNFKIESLKKPYVPDSVERQLFEKLIEKIDIDKLFLKAGIVQALNKDQKSLFLKYLFQPTFNISTLKSGFLENGYKNMVANSALVNIDIRFAHHISAESIFKEIESKLKIFTKSTDSIFDLKYNMGYSGSRVPINSIISKVFLETCEIMNLKPEIWPLSAAAAPLSILKTKFDKDFIVGGLGIGGYAHAPNEFIQVSSILDAQLFNLYFLNNYCKFLD